jgi:hypothetical protein
MRIHRFVPALQVLFLVAATISVFDSKAVHPGGFYQFALPEYTAAGRLHTRTPPSKDSVGGAIVRADGFTISYGHR